MFKKMLFGYKKKYARKGKKTYKRKSYKKAMPIKKMIRREIARNVENKTSQFYNYDVRLYVAGNVSFPTDNIFPVGVDPTSLVIPPGTGQGNRIGNTIKTKKLMFRGSICPRPQDATFNPSPQPSQLKMYIFYDKTDPNAVPNPQAANDFFQNGNSSKGFQNDLVDMWSPVNTDRYRVLATKTFKIGHASSDGTGANASNQFFANNDFKYNCNFSFNLTKHYPQMVKFNDGSTVPTTRGLFCMIQYVAASGFAYTTSFYSYQLQYMLDYQYEDA